MLLLSDHKIHRLIHWLFISVCLAVVHSESALAAPVNDAYKYHDDFGDNTGIDLNSTGFINLGGTQTAKSKTNQLISQCFHLPDAAGGNFTGWSFAEVSIDNLDQVQDNDLYIESCDGATNFLTVNPPVGTSAYDLSAVPVSNTHLRFRWSLKYQGNGGARTAAVSSWRALGTATGSTVLTITPSTTSTSSNAEVAFTLSLSSTGATTRNPVLEVDLNKINGTPGIGAAGNGLATDATVCYDTNNDGTAGSPSTECARYRPLELLAASNGTSGEPPDLSGLSQPAQTPATGGNTDGIIKWQLQDLPEAYGGSISVNMHVPKGYIDGKTLALAATLTHGEMSADGSQNNFQSVSSNSPVVTVNSEHSTRINAWSPFGNLGPGAQNIQDTYYIRNNADQSASPSDHENITVEIYSPASSTCVPEYRNHLASSRYNWPIRTVPPATGAPLDSNPLRVTFFRASYANDSSNARVRIIYDIPNNCATATVARTTIRTLAATPPVNNTPIRSHNILFNACRGAYSHMHRLQSGLLVENSFLPYPGWNEYYINNGSVRPGEFISTWSPFGDSTYRTHTIVLDKSYAIVDVPAATTFHGYRNRNKEDTDSKIYFFKDPTGTAPDPVDAVFNNDFDPATQSPAAGWYPVQRTWSGPFTSYTGNAADANNPAAVVGPNSRLMAVKTNDNTSFGASDNGLFRAQAIWRVCDGSYGCAQSPDDTSVRVTGNTFTYQQTQPPFARYCSAMSGYTAFVRSVSYPKVYTDAVQQNVQAGGIASIILTPHNSNMASQFVDGHWSFDLTDIAASIDLNNVTGEVISSGFNLPGADQNVQGQTCSESDIVFVAPTTANPIAYWNLPDRCQIPNGWGLKNPNNTAQDNYTPAYQLKLNVPIKTTTLANTVLDFKGQIRRKDLSAPGADNAVTTTRWAASNYQSITPVTVLENPSIVAIKSAPSGWPVNSTFSYSIAIENQGNTPLAGFFLVDELPRTGTNGSEFDPLYGSVFINAAPGDIVVESSEDTQCNIDHLNATWVTEALSASTRTGFQSQTAALADTTLCIRFRRAAAGALLPPLQSINLAVDITIPNDVFLSGKSLYNKVTTGVTDTFGGTSNIASSETSLVSTVVDGAVVLGAEKSTTAALDKSEQVAWLLRYYNASGTDALSVTVSDNLPAEAIYQGLLQTLPAGIACTHGSAGDINNDGINDCALINAAADGSGGTLEFTIALLTPSDGNPGAGTDEGQIGIWTTLQTTNPIENCVYAIPAGGVSGSDCVMGQLSAMTIVKSQTVDSGRTGSTPPVYFGEVIKYALTIENTGATANYLRLTDQLPPQVSFIPGSLTIDGASASDGLISAGVLSYTSILTLAPGAQTVIEFSTRLTSATAGSLVKNQTSGMLCANRTSLDSCGGARTSNQVSAEIQGTRIEGLVFEDNGSGSAIAHNADVEGSESPVQDIQVTLIHVNSNQQIQTTHTDANGVFNFFPSIIPGDNYQIKVMHSTDWLAVSHHKGNTQATETSPVSTTLSFQAPSSTTAYSDIRFGLVKPPVMHSDQTITSQPAASVLIPHTLNISSPASITFDLADAQSVSILDGWQVDLFHDLNCDQQLATTDPVITSAITADPDTFPQLCLLFKINTPDSLAQSLTLSVPLNATIDLEDAAGTGHSVSGIAGVVDTIEIILLANGHLQIDRQVSNVSRNQTMAIANQAIPGEILRHQINFEVIGASDITQVVINDNTPAFTTLSQPVSCPSGLYSCIVLVPAAAQNTTGYSGPIQWRIADTLPAGANGTVFYEVSVD